MTLQKVRAMPVQGKPFNLVIGMIKTGARPLGLTFRLPSAAPDTDTPAPPSDTDNPFMKTVGRQSNGNSATPTSPKRENTNKKDKAPQSSTSSSSSSPSQQSQQQQRILVVDILRARHLRKADRFGSADPYVVVECGGEEQCVQRSSPLLCPFRPFSFLNLRHDWAVAYSLRLTMLNLLVMTVSAACGIPVV